MRAGAAQRSAAPPSAPLPAPTLTPRTPHAQHATHVRTHTLPAPTDCSDGWDRTSGLTSLALLQIDPHYRTLPGFCTLIAREWCNFGHRFGRRNGTGVGEAHACRESAADDQRAPVFLQFVDALWQMTRQHPTAFEFNDRLLVALADHSYSGAYGTFLMDCEADRAAFAAPGASQSLWDVFLGEATRARYTNPHYAPPAAVGGGVPVVAVLGAGAGAGAGASPFASSTTLAPLLPSRAHYLPILTDVRDVQVWPLWVLRFGT